MALQPAALAEADIPSESSGGPGRRVRHGPGTPPYDVPGPGPRPGGRGGTAATVRPAGLPDHRVDGSAADALGGVRSAGTSAGGE